MHNYIGIPRKVFKMNFFVLKNDMDTNRYMKITNRSIHSQVKDTSKLIYDYYPMNSYKIIYEKKFLI